MFSVELLVSRGLSGYKEVSKEQIPVVMGS